MATGHLNGVLALAFLTVVTTAATPTSASTLPSGTLQSFDLRLENLERATDRLFETYKSGSPTVRRYPLQTRLIDARVLYRMGNYESSSVLFVDLVENDEFKSYTDYPDALLMLSTCLLKLGNPRGARRYLELAVKTGNKEIGERAHYHLLNDALDRDNTKELRELLQVLSTPTGRKARYATGKALIILEDFPRAIEMLTPLFSDKRYGAQSKYYVGLAWTALKELEKAKAFFSPLSTLSGKGEQVLIRDLAILALGRIEMESGDLIGAINIYQKMKRYSTYHEVSLFEMAWAYIKSEQYDMALSTIDTLLLTVKDAELDLEAHSLRGRLNIYLNDYKRASESFEKVVERFAPIRNELEDFTSKRRNIHRYFDWLLKRESEGSSVDQPLSRRTAAWIETGDEIGRVAEVFGTLGEQRAEVKETTKIAKQLQEVIKAGNRVEFFPKLKDAWIQASVLQNQLIMLSSNILDLQYAASKEHVVGEERAGLDAGLHWRTALETRFKQVPTTFEAYGERKDRVDQQFVELKKQAFVVGQQLKGIQRDLMGIDRYLTDKTFKEDIDKFTAEEERDFRNGFIQEKENLKALYASLDRLNQDLDLSANTVGTGDVVSQSEAELKSSIKVAHEQEGLAYDRAASRGARELVAAFAPMSGYRERIWSAVDKLNSLIVIIDENVGVESAKLQRLIEEEAQKLLKYSNRLRKEELKARRLARDLGEKLFDRTHDRMKRVVLKAEVGLIDVAWQMKLQETDAIRAINRQRSKMFGEISRTLKELTTEKIAFPMDEMSAPASKDTKKTKESPPPSGQEQGSSPDAGEKTSANEEKTTK